MGRTLAVSPIGMKLIDWRAAALAGLIGGCAYLLMQFLAAPLLTTAGFSTPVLTGDSPWIWVRMSAAIVLGREILTPPDTFSLLAFVAALLLHFVLSLVYGTALAFLLYRWPTWPPGSRGVLVLCIGAAFGFLLYVLNYYAFTRWLPWFIDLRHWVTIFNNVVFGAVTALAYVALVQSHRRAGRE